MWQPLKNSGQWFSDSIQINMEAENKFPWQVVTRRTSKHKCVAVLNNVFTPKLSLKSRNMVPPFEYEDQTLMCVHSNKSYWAVLSCGCVTFSMFYKMVFKNSSPYWGRNRFNVIQEALRSDLKSTTMQSASSSRTLRFQPGFLRWCSPFSQLLSGAHSVLVITVAEGDCDIKNRIFLYKCSCHVRRTQLSLHTSC